MGGQSYRQVEMACVNEFGEIESPRPRYCISLEESAALFPTVPFEGLAAASELQFAGALHLRTDERRQFAHYARGDVRGGVVRGFGVVQLAQPIDVFGSQHAVHSGRLPYVLGAGDAATPARVSTLSQPPCQTIESEVNQSVSRLLRCRRHRDSVAGKRRRGREGDARALISQSFGLSRLGDIGYVTYPKAHHEKQ